MKGWQDLLAFWQIEANHPARLIAVAAPKGSTGTLTLSDVQNPRTANTDISASDRGLRSKLECGPNSLVRRGGTEGPPVGDPLAGYLTMMQPPMGVRSIRLFRSEGQPADRSAAAFRSLSGRAVFHRVAASRTGFAPRLQLDRL